MGSRFFRVFLVCFLVCMLVCSPALAASTTDSQIMMMSDEDDPDAGIMPLVLAGSEVYNKFSIGLYNSSLQRLVSSYTSTSVFNWGEGLNYIDRSFIISHDFAGEVTEDYDKVVFSFDFYLSDQSVFSWNPCNIQFGNLFFRYAESSSGPFSFFGLNPSAVSYNLWFGSSFSDAVKGSEIFINSNSLSGSTDVYGSSDFGFSANIPFSSSVIGSTIYNHYKLTVNVYYDRPLDKSITYYRFGVAGSGSNYFSYRLTSSPSSSQQNQETQDAIKETTEAVNQVNQSIRQTISAVQQVSADLAALSNAVQQMTQQFLSGLEQQTNAISSLVTAQIQQIRQDLGLVNDNLSSGFSSVTNSITNQTQQVTQKIDSLQQNVVNKLDTVNQSITDLTDETKKGFDDVKKGITDLPGKIGEMLKSLIVPDSEQLADKYSDFTDLAEEKLGVIYQVPEMVFEMAQTVVNGVTNQETQMQLPAFKLVMPDAEYTLWEEQKFDIWPAGTEAIQNAVQLATSMLCVILTFNSLKRKYEEWLDGR